MPLRLSLICHGATSATRRAAFPADEPLEDGQGVDGPRLRDLLRHVDRAVASPALRARQTAAMLGLEATEVLALRDQDHGRWAGRTLLEVQDEEPDGLRALFEDPDAAPHGGETQAALLARVSAWLDAVSSERGHVVAVTHAAIARAAIVTVLDAPTHAVRHIDIPPLSLTDLRHDGRRWALRAAGIPLGAPKE